MHAFTSPTTYENAKALKAKLDQEWEEYAVNNNAPEAASSDYADFIKALPDGVHNCHAVKFEGSITSQVVELNSGVYLLPPGVMSIDTEMIPSSARVNQEYFDQELWCVQCYRDDFDW